MLNIPYQQGQTVQITIDHSHFINKINEGMAVDDVIDEICCVLIEFKLERSTNIRFELPRWIKVKRTIENQSGL